MDFSMGYSPEQEAFRIAARTWLAEYAPTSLTVPADGGPLNAETQEKVKAFRRILGEKGWLAPSWPKEYGGGGLSRELDLILMQEMRELELPSMGDNTRWIPAMMVWGSEEQKRRFVEPCLRGKTITWQAFNEPDSGSDFATVHTRAAPEEGGYRINGSKAFITGRFDPDFMVTLAVTDPERPRRMNLGVFMVDANLPGVSIKTMRMLMGSERRVYFDDVFVTDDCLLGPPYQGWEIAQSIIEAERGGTAFRISEDGTIESIYSYLRSQRSEQDG
ncbi:MAG: acyl-CoA dehydrogenase family protein [SAR202 cluster bacterium]|jgi:alkylation response protein AidB-like acyl-CoA dehydrogenase|nr:acyl-CoA dehydrogenase family protein [SAR202 cluster bacterium]|tara:strand:+ start:3006 stop:3830 length:825 start_codon:yes stop_codon:yes gene_type:complete